MSLDLRNIAVLLLTDAENKVLLQHRTDDAPAYAGQWGLFGGGVEKGETADEAIHREAWEELRAKLTHPTCFLNAPFRSPYSYGVRSCYHQLWSEEDKSTLELHEGKGWGWFTIDEALMLDIPPHIPEVLEALRAFLAQA